MPRIHKPAGRKRDAQDCEANGESCGMPRIRKPYLIKKIVFLFMATDYHSILIPGSIYHFYNKAVNNRKSFYEERDYRRFIKKFKKYFSPYLNVFAYCLIPNHFHFLVQVKEIDGVVTMYLKKENTNAANEYLSDHCSINDFITDQFRRFLSSHSLYINKKYNRSGPLFLTKSKRTEITSEFKFYDLFCYIHHNPIHHGLTTTYEDWPYSSYLDYSGTSQEPGILTMLEILGHGNLEYGFNMFMNLHKEFKEKFNERG